QIGLFSNRRQLPRRGQSRPTLIPQELDEHALANSICRPYSRCCHSARASKPSAGVRPHFGNSFLDLPCLRNARADEDVKAFQEVVCDCCHNCGRRRISLKCSKQPSTNTRTKFFLRPEIRIDTVGRAPRLDSLCDG